MAVFFSPNFAKSDTIEDPLPIMISNWHHFFFCLVCCCLGKIKEDANNNQTLLTVHACFSYMLSILRNMGITQDVIDKFVEEKASSLVFLTLCMSIANVILSRN